MKVTLLDGGMGQELIHRAGDRPTPLWSTQVMIDRPGLVQEIHADYFAAGATVATANSYAVLRDRLIPAGIKDRYEELVEAAMAEATQARDAFGGGKIAGSTAPLGATYRTDKHPDLHEAIPLYAEKARLMAPRADLILIETAASLLTCRAALEGVLQAGRPVWLSISVDDEDGSRLRSGEKVADVLPIARDGAAAVLINCSAPEAMPAALDILARVDLPIGAYANAFTRITKDFLKDQPTVDSLEARRDMGPETYAGHAMSWLDHGATILGGCCETGPAHIAEIASRLRAAGHEIA
ncbi:homocysteine S-methyltransferase family protein [Sagittula stellata]|uniref:Homocysteine S-methyltransferase family protein n=1 Tax=Sagittula stellata (strain ATCC 700073 / DSM 11524 / E-37) TaxID=388399 RepID=A3K3T6_SAGS3|nr:homocysteine S-methyltransferase family protein [Sagittula stellata]EBA08200.1 homocysteine S-methyltransferase family protein [Sagittula stellata E-37]